jgi:Trypsin
MIKRFGVAVGLLSSLAGCSAATDGGEADSELGVNESGIVRADSNGGPQYAVAVIGQTIFGGHRYCSGVYVAPRVVITAAHCLTSIVERTIVYWGADVTADQAQFDADDDPSKPWTVAESWLQHPDYDPNLHYPDLAVVYLQHDLPFQPAELARFRLRSSDIGSQLKIVGWGASRALTPDISQFEGIGIQRQAKFPFLGSPTQADFVPADPNNGLFVPAIRANLAKFDGTAPESNSCAGDSGAPILVKRDGRSYVAAINFFTGLSCEGYSMATRVEPFLSYFDNAIKKGGASPITPSLNCVDKAADGSLTAYFGYDNQNAVSVDIPFGRNNRLRDDKAGVRPTHFLPGPHPWSFFLGFDRRERPEYDLRSPDARCHQNDASVAASVRSPRCDALAPDVSCARFCKTFDACGVPFGDCMNDCLGSIPFFEQDAPQCLAPWAALNRCIAALPTEDACNFSSPPSCVQESAAYDACFAL